jgi:hypothetical protein
MSLSNPVTEPLSYRKMMGGGAIRFKEGRKEKKKGRKRKKGRIGKEGKGRKEGRKEGRGRPSCSRGSVSDFFCRGRI